MIRAIGVITTGRADYGLLRPVMSQIAGRSGLALTIYATGTHLSRAHGMTVDEIEADGFEVAERVEMLTASDSPLGVATTMALTTLGFAQCFARCRPDILVVLGDRSELHAAVVAALPFNLPIAHLHGGESTEGAIDDPLRHSVTKMSHLHFPATEFYARRILQMGEESWRITVAGAPSLDNLTSVAIPDRATLGQRLGFDEKRPFLLVTYHPVTREPEHASIRTRALIDVLEDEEREIVVTHPNADTGRHSVLAELEGLAARRTNVRLVVSAGIDMYFGLMAHAEAMVGNSSSGIVEAASFELPVVNIGIRQQGRLRPPNVIDAGDEAADIRAGLDRALSPMFRAGLRGMTNPYGDGRAAERIVERVANVEVDRELLIKRFGSVAERS